MSLKISSKTTVFELSVCSFFLAFICITAPMIHHHLWFFILGLLHISTKVFCLQVHTHGLCVHKAASGAFCCGQKHGTAPPLGRCRYPRTRWCCTSGTGMSLLCRAGLLCLVWEGVKARGTRVFYMSKWHYAWIAHLTTDQIILINQESMQQMLEIHTEIHLPYFLLLITYFVQFCTAWKLAI